MANQQEMPALASAPDVLTVVAAHLKESHPQGADWYGAYEQAVRDALSERPGCLDGVWSRFSYWLLREIAHHVRSKDRDHMDNAMQYLMWSNRPMSERELSYCLDRISGFGSAAIFLMSTSSASVATAYAIMVSRTHPQYARTALLYAATGRYAYTFMSPYTTGESEEQKFYAYMGAELIELINQAHSS